MDPEEIGTGGHVDLGALLDVLHDYVWDERDE